MFSWISVSIRDILASVSLVPLVSCRVPGGAGVAGEGVPWALLILPTVLLMALLTAFPPLGPLASFALFASCCRSARSAANCFTL
jgi:hypothetical protein